MKNKKKFFLFCLSLFILSVSPIFSLFMGRDGESYLDNGVLWQPVKFEDGKTEFKALFPGEPRSVINSKNGETWYAIYSVYGSGNYQFHTDPSIRFEIPKNKKAFEAEMKTILDKSEVLTLLDISDKKIVYAAEFSTYEEGTSNLIKIFRLYLTKDGRAFYAFIEGSDFTLATDFFNSFQFSD